MSDSAATVWFLDTSSLLSMALDEEIEAAILDEIGADRVVIIDIVHDELTHRAGIPENWTAPSFLEAVTSGKVGTRDIEEAAPRRAAGPSGGDGLRAACGVG